MSLDKIMQSVDCTPRVEVVPIVVRTQLSVKECVGDIVRHWFTERGKVRIILTVGMGEWQRDNFIRELKMRVANLVVCAADDYFMLNGEYQFNPNLLTRAHAKCQSNAYHALRAGNFVVVTNTNCQLKHIMEYSSNGSRLKFNQGMLIIKFMPRNAADAVGLGINNAKKIPQRVYSTVYDNMQALTLTRDSVPKLEGVMTVCE